MPGVDVHCAISKERTGKEFRELHEWMDAPQKELGVNHRIERHTLNDVYLNFVEKEFGGEKAIVEWLFHIAIDNLETANMFAVKVYNSSYDKIEITFQDKIMDTCKFIKTFKNSIKYSTYTRKK